MAGERVGVAVAVGVGVDVGEDVGVGVMVGVGVSVLDGVSVGIAVGTAVGVLCAPRIETGPFSTTSSGGPPIIYPPLWGSMAEAGSSERV